jgi:membrane-associated phospholipid phosphatase
MPPFYAHDPFLALHQALQARWLDLPMAVLSTACEGWSLGIIGLAWFSWLERTVKGALLAWASAVLALIADGIAVERLKVLWDTPRPLAVYGPGEVHVLLEPLFRFGFPSGHSAAAATLATFAALAYGRRGAVLYGLAILGGLSRVYVGAHWVFDVLGGWVLGLLVGMLVYGLALRLPGGDHLRELRSERNAQRRTRSQSSPSPAGRGSG